MAQLVGQVLELVSAEVVVIPETAIVRGSGGALDALVTAQVEIVLCGMGDVGIYSCASGNIATSEAMAKRDGGRRGKLRRTREERKSINPRFQGGRPRLPMKILFLRVP